MGRRRTYSVLSMADGISTDLVPRADTDRGFRYEQQKWIVWRQERKNIML